VTLDVHQLSPVELFLEELRKSLIARARSHGCFYSSRSHIPVDSSPSLASLGLHAVRLE
jgi:hypothetical protein